MNALFGGRIRFKPVCRCIHCGREELSSETNSLDLNSGAIVSSKAFFDSVRIAVDRSWKEPPIGWSVSGADNFCCGCERKG